MLKSKFLAGLLATLVALIVVVGIVILAVLVFDLGAENKILTYGSAALAVAIWGGMYSWLKPKDPAQEQTNQAEDNYKDGELPPRHS